MITLEDLTNKTKLELIQILINDLKDGNINQLNKLDEWVRAGLQTVDKNNIEQILHELIQYCENISENDNNAILILGYLHEFGLGVPQNDQIAINFYQKIIHTSSEAIFRRAIMYHQGKGSEVNYAAAIELYEQAIALGNSDALYYRAFMHRHGKDGPINYPAAIELYEQAIALGDTNAMNLRASMHENEEGGPINYPAAIELYEQAIALGDTNAMTSLAFIHLRGRRNIDPVDIKKAARLLRRAAEQHDEIAHWCLSDSKYNILKYHYAMLQNNISDATKLILNDLTILDEFIEFDCKRVLENSVNLNLIKYMLDHSNIINATKLIINDLNLFNEFIEVDYKRALQNSSHFNLVKSVIDHLDTIYLNPLNQHDIYCKLLLAIDTTDRQNDCISAESTLFKAEYITKLDVQNISLENLMPIMQLTLDIWDGCYEAFADDSYKSFTEDAARIVCQLVQRSKELTNEYMFDNLSRHIAHLLLKNIYNEYDENNTTKLNIYLIDFSMAQIEKLVRFNNLSIHPSIDKMNEILKMHCVSISAKQSKPDIEENRDVIENIAISSNRFSAFNYQHQQDRLAVNENEYSYEYKSGK